MEYSCDIGWKQCQNCVCKVVSGINLSSIEKLFLRCDLLYEDNNCYIIK